MSEDLQPGAPFLLIKGNDDNPWKYSLEGNTSWSLGRDQDNQIVLLDSSVSRHHAILQYLDSNSIYLIDLGSTNGSFVNQRRVSIPTLLQDGDQVTLGQSEMEFHSSTPAAVTVAPTPDASGAKTSVLHLRHLISVVVVDIRGFTQLTQLTDERQLSQVLGEWFRRAGEIIRSHNSRVDKYIGDAVMAVWIHSLDPSRTESIPEDLPATISNVLPPLKALRSLFEMTRVINNTAEFVLPRPLRIGAGMNTGYAIVGQMGSGERQEYTVIGDTVNMTFRIESATRDLDTDIAISEGTYSVLANSQDLSSESSPSEFFRQDNVMLKGYSNKQRVYHCYFEELCHFLDQCP